MESNYTFIHLNIYCILTANFMKTIMLLCYLKLQQCPGLWLLARQMGPNFKMHAL
jgi:hypothetical protein